MQLLLGAKVTCSCSERFSQEGPVALLDFVPPVFVTVRDLHKFPRAILRGRFSSKSTQVHVPGRDSLHCPKNKIYTPDQVNCAINNFNGFHLHNEELAILVMWIIFRCFVFDLVDAMNSQFVSLGLMTIFYGALTY